VILLVWYEAKIVYTLIGACITIITFTITQVINAKREKKNIRRSVLNTLSQSNRELFSLIYTGSINETNIDYPTLRKQLLNNSSFFVLLPEDLQTEFDELYKIHLSGAEFYEKNRARIPSILKKITVKLKDHGVDTFG
jgi:hypothetical protein